MKLLNQYRGLRRELYIVFWGRVVTAMGGLIWPMLTLILKNKLGYSAKEVANLMILVGIILLPCTLIGGKLADRFNKKNIIVICDLVTVAGYLLCAVLPMSRFLVVIFCISGIFAQIESPSYDTLVANLSTQEERERAYSLNYMGMNLGLVLAPTLGGLLFENHLSLAFFISGAATFSSTVLIFFFIKDITPSRNTTVAGQYEEALENASTREVFSTAPVLVLFALCMGFVSALYQIGNGYMLPMTLEQLFGSKGALVLGTLTSVNALVVIIGTPLCTGLFERVKDTGKLLLGELLQMLGFAGVMLAGGRLAVYYASMVVFTFGEILNTLGNKPYITKRVPSSHRGRISSVITVSSMLLQGLCLSFAGFLSERIDLPYIWFGILALGGINLLLLALLRKRDRAQYPLLYQAK